MHSGVNQERVHVREQRIQEIRTESGVLRLVEVITLDQVRFGFNRGSRFSPKLLANLVLGFLPILELGGAIGNSLLTLIKNVFMP